MKIKVFTFIIFLILSSIAYGGDYVIGEGDVIRVSVWGEEELNLSVKVRPDGKIGVPASGEVEAAGYTPRELQEILTEKIKAIVKNPIVTVIVEGINNTKVYVFGGGVNSSVYNLTQRTTLLQLLCQIGNTERGGVGNPRDFSNADLRKAYILRNGKKIKKGFYKLFVNGDIFEDIIIRPNDIIFIPPFVERNVYVVGAVNTPKFIPYRDDLTVMEAVLQSGGFTKFASKNNVTIHRKNGNKETFLRVKLKDLMTAGDFSQNIKLKPGDYIIVKEGIF